LRAKISLPADLMIGGRPTVAKATIGLSTTLINVYTARDGRWSVVAIVTAAVTGGIFGISLGLCLLYDFVYLERVKMAHQDGVEQRE